MFFRLFGLPRSTVDWERCKMQNLLQTVYLFHAFYTLHMTCFVFFMRMLFTSIFFQNCFSRRLLVAKLMVALFPRLLRAILKPLGPSTNFVETMNLWKSRIQRFTLSWRNFLNSFSKSLYFFCVFPKSFFSKPTSLIPVVSCQIESPNLLDLVEKQDSRFTHL